MREKYKLKITKEAEKYMKSHTVGEVYILDLVDGVLQVYKVKE